MIEIERTPSKESVCECCGGTTTRLTRFVSDDGDAIGVYYAAFSDNHPDSNVVVLLSLGNGITTPVPKTESRSHF
ncbi:MAG TPA: hypothetical protein PKO33_00510 [Pyrinomonadaceae bacterium]|nr:hypothetical protein [Pyrinomonadaceae bacterium]